MRLDSAFQRRLSIRPWLLCATGAFASVMGCQQAGPGNSTPVVTDSAGVEIVHNAEHVLRLALNEDLRLGMADGPEHLQFFRVGPIAVDAGGRLIVADNGSGQIRIFSPDGSFVRSFGRHGGAPGEYALISGVIAEGDRLVVIDTNERATVLDSTGQVLDVRSLRFGEWVVLPFATFGSGWLARVSPSQRPSAVIAAASHDTVRIAMVPAWPALPPTGELPIRAAFQGGRRYEVAIGGYSMSYAPLWEPRPGLAADAQGRLYVSSGSIYEIDVYSADGKLTRRIRRTHTQVAVTQELRDRYLALVNAFYDSVAARGVARREEHDAQKGRAALYPREALPVLGDLRVSTSGTVWVERPDLAPDAVLLEWRRAGAQPSRWDVFDEAGGYVATVELPAGFTPRAVGSDWVLGVIRDELDVEYVVRLIMSA